MKKLRRALFVAICTALIGVAIFAAMLATNRQHSIGRADARSRLDAAFGGSTVLVLNDFSQWSSIRDSRLVQIEEILKALRNQPGYPVSDTSVVVAAWRDGTQVGALTVSELRETLSFRLITVDTASKARQLGATVQEELVQAGPIRDAGVRASVGITRSAYIVGEFEVQRPNAPPVVVVVTRGGTNFELGIR